MPTKLSDAAKARQIQVFFQRHGRIHILVDATADDVRLPEHLRGDPAVPLVLNVRMPQPIYIRPEALESEFSFGGVPYACRIPLHRIWAMYVPGREKETAVVWEECIPEVLRAAAETMRSAQQAPSKPTPDARSPAEEQGPSQASSDRAEQRPKTRKPHLRLVK